MSVDMYVSVSQSQASSVSTMCKSQLEGYNELQKAITDFVIASPFLTGKAYDSAKVYFEVVLYPLVQGGILLSEAVENAVNKFPEEYIFQVDSGDLKQSELEEKIRRADRLLNQAKEIRREVNSSKTSDITKSFQLTANSMLIGMYSTSKQKLEEQLQELLTFNTSSPSLFSEITSLQQAVNQGLAQTKTAWNGVTGTFNIPNDLSWKITINEKWGKYQIKKMSDNELFFYNMKKQYGFNSEESQIIDKLYNNLEKLHGKEEANRLLIALLASFQYGGNIQWSYTGALFGEKPLHLILAEAGRLTDKEIELLSKAIINQHNLAPVLDIKQASRILFDSNWEDLSKEQQARVTELFTQFGNRPDFAHMCATIATYYTKSPFENIADELLGILYPVSGLDVNSGYIGDVAGTNGAIPSMGNDDYYADLDAVNIYAKLQGEKNINKVFNDYYKNIESVSDYRVNEFIKNIGNGSYEEGWLLLQKQYTQFINSETYKNMGVNDKKVFAEFLINLMNKNSKLKSGNK